MPSSQLSFDDIDTWIGLLESGEAAGRFKRGFGIKIKRWPLLQALIRDVSADALPFDPTKAREPGGFAGWKMAFDGACKVFFGGDWKENGTNGFKYFDAESFSAPVCLCRQCCWSPRCVDMLTLCSTGRWLARCGTGRLERRQGVSGEVEYGRVQSSTVESRVDTPGACLE